MFLGIDLLLGRHWEAASGLARRQDARAVRLRRSVPTLGIAYDLGNLRIARCLLDRGRGGRARFAFPAAVQEDAAVGALAGSGPSSCNRGRGWSRSPRVGDGSLATRALAAE